MSDSEDSTVTYTAVSSPYEDSSDMGSPGVEGPPIMPEDPHAYMVAIFQAPSSLDYVPSPEEPEQSPPSPVYLPYVPEPSPGYIHESNLKEDDEEDPEEDPANYLSDRGDDGDDEESSDDDDVEEDEEDEDEEEEEEEHLTPANPVVALAPFLSKEDAERFLALPTPPLSPLSPYSSPLPQIPSLPLLIPSPPPNSPTYIEEPLGFRAVKIKQRDTPPSHVHETEIPEICLPLRKRPCRTAPTPGYEVGESLAAGAARQDGPAIARVDLYGFVDMEIVPTTLEGVNQRVTELVATVDQEDGIMYSLLEDAQEDRSLLRGRVNMLFRDRPYHRRIALLIEEEARVSRVAWAQSMDASDKTRFEGMSLRTTVIAQQSEITELYYISCDLKKMAPKRRTTRETPITNTPTTTSVTNAQMQAMIDQGVTAALAARDATRNGDDSHT
ncbi:hypothetical protein Tco_0716136 [Tanacetum coccineum]